LAKAKPFGETPASKQSAGDKKLLKGGLDPSIGKDTQFQPGVSGNPTGRSKRMPVTDRALAMLEVPLPEDVRLKEGFPEGTTYGDAIVRGQFQQAIRYGSTHAFNALADRAEGKPRQPVDMMVEMVDVAKVIAEGFQRAAKAKGKK
jgi:Family of unknown function (DUF5681)